MGHWRGSINRKEAGKWRRWVNAAVLAGVLGFLVLLLGHFREKYGIPSRPSPRAIPSGKDTEGQQPRTRGTPAWVMIRYDDLVDRDAVTHSGKTVGRRLEEIAKAGKSRPDREISELQPFLEPFSSVCNDVVSAAGPSETTSYRNVVADYPAGSRQPAWAAMFREGIYQLFVAGGKARLFLRGEDPGSLLERTWGVVRHPLGKVLGASGTDRLTVEVFAFRNDYAERTIHLDIHPHVVDISRDRLARGGRHVPLDRLEEFFRQGVMLEAAGIDGNGDFCLYGTPSPRQTVAGYPLSLEDFAVVYRSVFHNGGNAPYISLDRHEDNRYAKVNFGGFLEDTRIGSVVLEADKLFKTLCTGLDPNARKPVQGTLRSAVPDFRTGAERGIREKAAGYSEIRYWFYPDKIQTVTDGSLGVVRNSRFTADAERMDRKVPLGRDQREVIDHLNRHYERYAQVFPTYKELDTVGRMMAIMNWIRQSGASERVDLDALLSVELSPVQTPRRTRKLLAVTAEVHADKTAKDREEATRKVYCMDNLLDGMKPSATDREMLDAAGKHFAQIRDPELFPSRMQKERASMDGDMARVRELEARLQALGSAIEREHGGVGRSGDNETRRLRAMAEEFRSVKAAYDNAVAAYNRSIPGLGGNGYWTNTLVSISGGIDLRPRDFAKPLNMPDSPLIQRIRNSKEIIRSSPSGTAADIGRGSTRTGEANPGIPSPKPGRVAGEKKTGEGVPQEKSGKKQEKVDRNSVPAVQTKGIPGTAPAQPVRKEVVVRNPTFPGEIVASGDFSAGGTIVLRRVTSGKGPGPREGGR